MHYELKLISNPQRRNSLIPRAELEAAEPVVAAGLHAEEGGLEGGIDLGMRVIILIGFISFVLPANVRYHTDRQRRIEGHVGTVEIRKAYVGENSYQMIRLCAH